MKLSPKQAELLERVCLKKYTVVFEHYMGSFRPNEYVVIHEEGKTGGDSHTFKATTANALRTKKLVQFIHSGQGGESVVKPTAAGLELFKKERGL